MERFLNDLSKVWNELSEDTQKNLATMITGQRNDSDLDLLIRNLKDSTISASLIYTDWDYMKTVENVFEKAVKWVHDNLNPHQAVIISSEGLKIVSDDLVIPNKYICLK
jgi:K+-sensing histidine kinase KdpD